jgi:sulfate adenylyltransferase subunit 1 (EFTu-like GTPase family)
MVTKVRVKKLNEQISIDDLSQAISSSMQGFQLDGISLPADARLLADVLGAMIYTKQQFVMIDDLPDATQAMIHKHIPQKKEI